MAGMADGSINKTDGERFVLDVRRIEVRGRTEGGRGCTVCELDEGDRHKLHIDLLSGVTYREISERFSLAKSSIHRHLVNHLWPEVTRLLAEEADLVGGDLMDAGTVITDLGAVRRAMAQISLSPATPTYDEDGNLIEHRMVDQINASKTLHSISRTALELTGHLKGNQTNVQVINATAVEGQIAPVLDQIMAALADHPEAAMAVAEALGQPKVIEARCTEICVREQTEVMG